MKMIKAFLFAAVAVVAAFVQAATEIVNGIEWTYIVTDGRASVYSGSSYSPAIPKTTSGAITIPSNLGGYPVTSIGERAFESCSLLTSVIIPNSVTNIGERAFGSCTSLISVTMPESIASMGDGIFRDCGALLSVVVPLGATKVPDETFYNCTSLTNVIIPSSVKLIGINAFYNCSSLVCVTIPDGVATLYGGAFERCTSLASIIIPNSVMNLESRVFYGCSSIASLTIPNSVTWIGSKAFYGCSSLTSVSIPNSVTDIGDSAFYNCPIVNATLPGWDCKINLNFVTNIVISEGTTKIVNSAFDYCSKLTSVTIPDSVTSIGASAFYGCSSLTSVTIPDSVTSIGNRAFYGCHSLDNIIVEEDNSNYQSIDGLLYSKDGKVLVLCPEGREVVTIPDSVTSIGASAFRGCSSLTSVTIPNSITGIGSSAFYGCSSLTSVTIPDSVTSIGSSAFYNCSSFTSITIPNSVTSIGNSAFTGCSSLISVTIGDGVTSIGDLLFYGCSSLTSVTIPDSVTSIGSSAFYGCSSLTSVTIPNSVTGIGSSAFYGCSSLTSITIPDSVTSIGDKAFCCCSSLENIIVDEDNNNYKSVDGVLCSKDGKVLVAWPGGKTVVTIPGSVTSIGNYAFYDCSSLTSVTIPNSVTKVGDSAFYGCYIKNATLPGWNCGINLSSVTNIVISEGTTNIVDSAFRNSRSLTSVTIPDTVTSIGDEAFSSSLKLTTIMMSSSLVSMGDGVFKNCTSLLNVEMPYGLTKIPDETFYNCTSLTNVIIPDSVELIGINAFYKCTSLASVMIPDGVTIIYYGAFMTCTSLTSVTIPRSVNGIGAYAFYNCESLTNVVFKGDAPKSIGEEIFVNTDRGCRVYVIPGSTGWGVNIPGIWNGVSINYIKYGDILDGEWNDGIIGEGEVKAYMDETVDDGCSVMFTANDSSSAWIETEVTNSCRVTFKWKSSCEPLVKGSPYDYLSFEVDGEQKGFICGETPWTEFTIEIAGDGVHRLRWCFQRDGEGSAGENSAWLVDLEVVSAINVSFATGGSTEGNLPDSFMSYSGESFLLPDQGSLLLPKHTFIGWSDGVSIYEATSQYSTDKDVVFTAQWARNELNAPIIFAPQTFEADSCEATITADNGATIHYTLDGSDPTVESPVYTEPIVISGTTEIKAIAIRDNYFDSSIASFTVTRGVWTFGEYLNWSEQEFTTSGDAKWIREKGVSDDGYALRSGDITHSQTSRLEAVVFGPGTISFTCRVEGEILKGKVWDGLSFSIDGVQQGDLIGDENWTTKSYVVTDLKEHILSWAYVKDDGDMGDIKGDCAWIDNVVWTPDSIPELPFTATADQVALALKGSMDAKLIENIKTVAEYAAFRDWALGLEGVTAQEVKDSSNAWLSYVLNTDKLIEGEVTESRLKVTSFNLLGENNLFSIKLKLDGVDVGDAATVENLLKIFAIEGTKELSDDSFSVDNVALEVLEINEGEVEFIVTPQVKGNSYFFRARMRDDANGVGMNSFSDKRDKVQLWEGGPYWATTNIGAEKPEDYGYYFWWGDTVGYKWENDKWVASDGSNSNFSFETSNTPTDNKSVSILQSEGWIVSKDGTYVLAPEHDAAQKHWGRDWRMPTSQEFNDLNNKCYWTWTTINGVNGYIVRGRGSYASNSIFLPCAGCGGGTSLSISGSYGYYLSSVPYSNSCLAYVLYFYSSYHGTNDLDGRLYGHSVRPVQGYTK